MEEPQSQVIPGPPILLRSTVNYTQPSLPSLLTTYGFEDKTVARKSKEKEKEKEKNKDNKKTAKKKTNSFDDEKDQQREKEKEERKASHAVPKRLERCTLETTPVTTAVAKTDLYHIVGLEDKLRREGKLKTPSDYNKFREEIDEPRNFYKTFKVKKTSDPQSYPSSIADHHSTYSYGGESHSHSESHDHIFSMAPSHRLEDQSEHLRTLSRISESRESPKGSKSRPDHWAITQQFKAVNKKRPSRKSLIDERNDLDKRFPKLEMPKLHCFTMDLAKKPPDPEEVRLQAELRSKEKQRKKAIRTYTKMYNLAMSNAAVSNRILDQHEDMDMIINGPDLCDVIADHHWMTAYGLREIRSHNNEFGSEEQTMPSVPTTQPTTVLGSLEHHTAGLEEPSSAQNDRQTSAASSQRSVQTSAKGSRKGSATSKGLLPEIEDKKPHPMPLTMTEMTEKCSIVEAKSLSTLWNNYMSAGK